MPAINTEMRVTKSRTHIQSVLISDVILYPVREIILRIGALIFFASFNELSQSPLPLFAMGDEREREITDDRLAHPPEFICHEMAH